jgi:hypothetical protein
MNIVLICICNFQEYILDNIKQLIKTGNENIYVITNNIFFEKFQTYIDNIILISIEELEDSYNYLNKSCLNRSFRNGFWLLTSMRFFYLYEFMKKYNIKDVIHLENDVLIYYNPNILNEKLDRNYLYIPFDCYKRNIASIVFIPDYKILEKILNNYDYQLNDMENFSIINKKLQIIEHFPIFINNMNENEEYQFVTKNFEIFNFIFDAAAIGQYLGGVDPRNIEGDSTKFVNETCIIKFDKYEIIWLEKDFIRKPFIKINEETYPIFNLHIHSKNLSKFIY